ncbi:MAG: winged helix-turn-helix domain-containing protein [Acidobacteria bacterium]|nr:winged helix-turn-helix domain-containing protein [Acidobacteriota bacterium]
MLLINFAFKLNVVAVIFVSSSNMGQPATQLQPAPKPGSRVGVFEFAAASGSLKRNGLPVRLQDQPARLLSVLLEKSGQLVTRDELRLRIWPSDTFVQFDASLNTAIGKVRYALRDEADNPVFIETVPRQGYRFIAPVQFDTLQPPAKSQKTKTLALAALVLLGVALWQFWPRFQTSSPAPAVRLAIALPPDTHLATYFGKSVAITSDGQTAAFIGQTGEENSRIWLRNLNRNQSTSVPGSEGARYVEFSPDGKSILFVQDDNLKLAPSPDLPIRTLARIGKNIPHSAVWSKDGFIYYVAPDKAYPASLWRVSPASAQPELMLTNTQPSPAPEYFLPVCQLKDGRLLISVFRFMERTIEVFDPVRRTRTPLHFPGSGGFLTPSNWLTFHEGIQIRAIRASLDPIRSSGSSFVILDGVMRAGWSGGNFAASETGTLVYAPQPRLLGDRQLVWVDTTGKESALVIPPGPYEVGEISPDGKHVLLYKYKAEDQRWSLNAVPLDGGPWIEIYRGSKHNPSGIWIDAGKSVLFTADDTHLVRRQVFPLGPVQDGTSNVTLRQTPISLDTRRNEVLFTEGYRPATIASVHKLSLVGGSLPEKMLDAGLFPTLSPDGNWLAMVQPGGVAVLRYPLQPGDKGIYIAPGTAPLWSLDGRRIYFRQNKKFLTAEFSTLGKPGFTNLQTCFESAYAPADNWNRGYQMHPDGKRFLFVKPDFQTEEARSLNVILNWFSEFPQADR